MRIIAGKSKGTRLSNFKGNAIRPTLDRVKESLFNQISPVIEEARFLDLFAGTGNIGIEALSRGAANVVFVEENAKAQDLICSNLKKCGFLQEQTKSWRLIRHDAFRAIEVLENNQESFELVYVDPPFEPEIYESCLLQLANSRLLLESSLVVVEHYYKKALPEKYDRIALARRRQLGDSCLSLYKLHKP